MYFIHLISVFAWEFDSMSTIVKLEPASAVFNTTMILSNDKKRVLTDFEYSLYLPETLGRFSFRVGGKIVPSETLESLNRVKVSLPKGLQAGKRVKVELISVYGPTIFKPEPAKSTLFEKNRYLLDVPRDYCGSQSYKVNKCTFSIDEKHSTGVVASLKVNEKEGMIFSAEFFNSYALPVVKDTKRRFEIGYFGAVYVKEHFQVQNVATALEGEFNRVPFSMAEQMHGTALKVDGVMTSIPGVLSKNTQKFEYFDIIGNISSSHASEKTKFYQVDLTPRFPLIGGWKTEFDFSYQLPIPKILTESADGSYRATFSFNHPLVKLYSESVEVDVLLPEGAVYKRIEAPREIEIIRISQEPSWCDTPLLGSHTKITFKFKRPFLMSEKESLNYKFHVDFEWGQFWRIRIYILMASFAVLVIFGLFFLARSIAATKEETLSAPQTPVDTPNTTASIPEDREPDVPLTRMTDSEKVVKESIRKRK
jgi:Ribophorin I